MQKKIIPLSRNDADGFLWVRAPDFTPPDKDGGVSACVSHEFEVQRSGDLRTLLSSFLESFIRTVNATAGVVRLRAPDGKTLQTISSAGLSADLQEEAENFLGLECEINDNAYLGHIVHASDISSCNSRQNCSYATCRFQSLVAAPLESPYSLETALGVLTIFFDVPCTDSRSCMTNVAAFAEIMSNTIEHSRINRELSRVERLSARQEIANEIHDSLAQTLTYARMRVSVLKEAIRSENVVMAAKYADDLDEALEMGQKSARELVTDFRCEMNSEGLLAALNDITGEFRKRNEIVLEYHNQLVDLDLPLEYEIQIYHIVREALANIARHSGATHARLFVDKTFGYYVFTIEDNGSGACTFTPVEGHYGVLIMRERAQRIHGTIKVESAAGLGTQVQLFFPEPSLDWRAPNE
ncbi:MAG: histidine kinase [Gallionellaceae bacterium]|jgi:two-component system nitrate/nitrite sensor histidine kinase NarX